jgi:uncharacterized membrane protein YqaE (UPF0057 family)
MVFSLFFSEGLSFEICFDFMSLLNTDFHLYLVFFSIILPKIGNCLRQGVFRYQLLPKLFVSIHKIY